jgi:hypothetical protein
LTSLISNHEQEQKNWILQSENIQHFTEYLKKSGNSFINNSIQDQMKLHASNFNSQKIYQKVDNEDSFLQMDNHSKSSLLKRKREFKEFESETKRIKMENKAKSKAHQSSSEEKEILICKMTLSKVLEKLNSLKDLKSISSEELKKISMISEEISKKCK